MPPQPRTRPTTPSPSGPPGDGTQLAVLIDSNIFIAVEDHASPGHVHGPMAAELLRRAQQLGYTVLVSHATRSDLLSASEPRRSQRRRALQRYLFMDPVHRHDPAIRGAFPPGALSSNDAADLELLEAFATGRAQWLVTEDGKLRRRARRAANAGAVGIEPTAVLSLAEAVDLFRALTGEPTLTVPAVARVKGYSVDLTAPIFHSLRADYAEFDTWWRTKVAAQNRDAIVLGEADAPDGIAVLKHETDRPWGLPADVIKICTFKVDDQFQGAKRGEALLKACIEYARSPGPASPSGAECLYVEVLPDKDELLAWLTRFGFVELPGAAADRCQLVMVKRLRPAPGDPPLPPLEHAVTYGPGSLLLTRAFVVPIQDMWHHLLFPDADEQGDLLAGTEGCGNAIRKAYLCRANTRQVRPGDTLLFAHTGDGPARLTAVGCVEETLASRSVEQLVRFVGTRTVYSHDQIADLCAAGEVLALLFRHDRAIENPVPVADLLADGVLNGVPQSITELSQEAVTWVRPRLAMQLDA